MVPGVADAESPAPKQMAKSLPAEAFRSPKFYELERRAIFQQKWILVSHGLKFKPDGPGSEYISQEFAGIPYFIIRTKDGFKAFHNSCRHRGFPIITKPEGHLGERSVLACMYHSWSYRQDGACGSCGWTRSDDLRRLFDQGAQISGPARL
jgi:phenylpropionate dioxygenase-like ring-hydroxylating dioxygenase large terminal subunit